MNHVANTTIAAESDILMTAAEWAAWMGWKSPGMAHQARQEGRVVLAPDGQHLLARASRARYQATADPAKQGVTQRHAKERAANSVPPGPEDPGGAPRYDFQNAKAKREYWAAEREQTAFRKEAGELIEIGAHVAAMADVGAIVRAKLEAWASVLPPQLVGRDESVARAIIAEQVESFLRDLVDAVRKHGVSAEAAEK